MIKHKELVKEIKLNILELIRDECKTLCNPNEGFMLWRSSAKDLKSFSFSSVHSDLDRISPFLSSVFSTITNNSLHATCAAAAIALRGRQPRMSAFAYYLNSILQYGGAKKAVFERLSKMSITTSHKAAVGKQKAMANEYRAGLCQLKHQNEIFLNMGAETHTVNEDEVISDHSEMALNKIFRSMEDLQLSGEQTNTQSHTPRLCHQYIKGDYFCCVYCIYQNRGGD